VFLQETFQAQDSSCLEPIDKHQNLDSTLVEGWEVFHTPSNNLNRSLLAFSEISPGLIVAIGAMAKPSNQLWTAACFWYLK
jgi:hypothetical protein